MYLLMVRHSDVHTAYRILRSVVYWKLWLILWPMVLLHMMCFCLLSHLISFQIDHEGHRYRTGNHIVHYEYPMKYKNRCWMKGRYEDWPLVMCSINDKGVTHHVLSPLSRAWCTLLRGWSAMLVIGWDRVKICSRQRRIIRWDECYQFQLEISFGASQRWVTYVDSY